MKILSNVISLSVLICVASSCGQSSQTDQAASDTVSTLDTNRLNTPYDTASVLNVDANDSTKTGRTPGQYQESNGKQAPRTNVGQDTTGKQEHDNMPR